MCNLGKPFFFLFSDFYKTLGKTEPEVVKPNSNALTLLEHEINDTDDVLEETNMRDSEQGK